MKTVNPKLTSPEKDKPDTDVLSLNQILLKATGLSLIFVLILLALTAAGIGLYAYGQLNKYLSAVGLTFSEAKELYTTARSTDPKKTNGKTNFLILGIDSVANKQDAPPLTDTILLASLDYSTGTVRGLSLPRDLWSPEYKTKINALYYYGLERNPSKPEQFSTEVISQMTTVPIDYTIVFSLNSISELVDILGGITIDVPVSFIDTEFPREDVDIQAATSEAELYETVEFKQGSEKMTSDRVTKYIRSRHSQGETGTDDDRAHRQQLVLSSLIKELFSKDVLLNPEKVGQLYHWYQKHLSAYVPIPETLAIGEELIPHRNSVTFSTHSLTIFPAVATGVITHPPVQQTDNQWSYVIRNQELFQTEIYDKLAL